MERLLGVMQTYKECTVDKCPGAFSQVHAQLVKILEMILTQLPYGSPLISDVVLRRAEALELTNGRIGDLMRKNMLLQEPHVKFEGHKLEEGEMPTSACTLGLQRMVLLSDGYDYDGRVLDSATFRNRHGELHCQVEIALMLHALL